MNHETSLFKRDLAGEQIWTSDPKYQKIVTVILHAQKITSEMNASYKSPAEIRELFTKLSGQILDESVWIMPPFYTDFGKNIKLGKGVFVNHACTFMDRGGITIEDDVFIGPKVNLITTNHPINPNERKSTLSKPIIIKKNVWIGVNATILPGVSIGENSIISAGSVVTKNVPANVIVAGVPAKIIKQIEEEK